MATTKIQGTDLERIIAGQRGQDVIFNLANYQEQAIYNQQVENATKEEVDSDFWSTQTVSNLFDLVQAGLGLNTKLSTDKNGKPILKHYFRGLSLWDRDLTEDEWLEISKEKQDNYDSKWLLTRGLESFTDGVWDTVRSVGVTGLETFVDVTNDLFGVNDGYSFTEKDGTKKYYDFSTREGQAEAYLDAELRNPNTSEERKNQLLQLKNEAEKNKTSTWENIKNWWNTSFVLDTMDIAAEILGIEANFKTNDAEDLNNRVKKYALNQGHLFSLYKDKINIGPVKEFFENIDYQKRKADAFDSFNKNIVRDREGRPISISDDSDLEPLSDEVVSDKFGKIHQVEKAEGSLWDKERIVTGADGLAVLNPTTGEPEYERVYSKGAKALGITQNLFSSEVGYEALGSGAKSAAEFLIPSLVMGGMIGKLGNIGKIGKAVSNVGIAAFQNNMESEQIGQDAFTQVYDEKLSEYSGITKNKISERLIEGGTSPEDALILTEASYQRELTEWAKNNEKLASKAWGQALVAGEIAADTNRQLIALNLFEASMITKALRSLRGVKAATASRNILSNPQTIGHISKASGKVLLEGASEYFEENWNNYATEKGKHLSAGKNYTFADFDMSTSENIESGILGFILGVGMGGVSVGADFKGQKRDYKSQQKYIEALEKLPTETKKGAINKIITGINVEDALTLSLEMKKARDSGNAAKLKELGERTLVNRTMQALQTGTAGKFVEVLEAIKNDEDTSEEDKVNLTKATSFVNQMADYYDTLPQDTKGVSRLLINKGNVLQIDNAIAEIESLMPGIENNAKLEEENKIRRENKGLSESEKQEKINNLSLDNNPTVKKAKEQIGNLKDLKAYLLEEQRKISSPEYQKELRDREKAQKASSIIKQANRSNIQKSVAKAEQIQQKPLTPKQKEEIIKSVDTEPKKEVATTNIVPSQKAIKVELSKDINQGKDEELSQSFKEVQDSNLDANIDTFNPDADIDTMEQRESLLSLSPVLYNPNNKAQVSSVNILKDRLKRFDEIKEKVGGEDTSFKNFFEYMIRETSAIEAEGMFNIGKQAYKEYYKENYPEKEIESEEELNSLYNDYFTFSTDIRGEENIGTTDNQRTSQEVRNSNKQEIEEVFKDKDNPTPSNLKASTGEELRVKGKKVASFSLKIPYLSQAYSLIIDKENGTVEFKTKDETILESAKPFLNWNIFTPGKKVKVVLPTINGKLTNESLSQPMRVWKGGKEIDNATFKDFLESVFKGEDINTLIQENTVEQLVEKELKAKGETEWSKSDIVKRIPTNLETKDDKFDNERDGIGKGLHEVEWWNPSNIADFTEDLLRQYPNFTFEEAKRKSRDIQEEIIQEANKELISLRVALIKSPNQTLDMVVKQREKGISLQNTNGELSTLKTSNPTSQVAILNISNNKSILTIGGKEFTGIVENLKDIQSLVKQGKRKSGASYMITQSGITKNDFGETVPVYIANEVHNNTKEVSKDLRDKQQNLNAIAVMIRTAEKVFFGVSDSNMNLNIATKILNKITGKDVSLMSKKEAGKYIRKAVDLYTGSGENVNNKYSAYPVSYQDGIGTVEESSQFRLNVKEGLNKKGQTIITGINTEVNGEGQEVVSFEEQEYQDFLKDNLYTQIKFQEIENANTDGSSIWVNDIQPKIILAPIYSGVEEKNSLREEDKEKLPFSKQVREATQEIAGGKTGEKIEEKASTSQFNDTHIDTIQQNLFGSTMERIPLDSPITLKEVFSILDKIFNDIVERFENTNKNSEAQFMKENRNKILGIGAENFRDSVREEILLQFKVNVDSNEEVDSFEGGEVVKNYNKNSYEQPISLSLGTKVRILFSGIVSKNNLNYAPFGDLTVYHPVDNMISSVQKAFSESSNNSINKKGGLVEAMRSKINRSKNKKTGISPYDFYTQIIDRLENTTPELQREIQYHLYNSPVTMSFVQYALDSKGNWVVKVLDADSKNPKFSIGNDFINGLKQSSLITMADSSKYSINKEVASKLQESYNKLKELDKEGKFREEETELLLKDFLNTFGFNVQDGVILSLLNPEFIGSKVSLFSSKGNGLLDVLINNLNRELGKQEKGEQLSFGEREKDSTFEGNISIYNNSSNFNELVAMEELLTFNPQISTYIAHKTINKYEQPKFISEQLKKLLDPNDKTLLIDLSNSHFSRNSMIVQMLKIYRNKGDDSSGNDLSQKIKLGLASLNVIKGVGNNKESGEISNLSFRDYFVSVIGFFAHTEEELVNMERVVGNESISVRLANMPFPAISDTGSMPLWSTVVYNLGKSFFKFDNNNTISFNSTLLEELYSQLVEPDILRIEAFLKSGVDTNIEGHDIGAGQILAIPGLNGLIIKDKNGNNTTLLTALRQSIYNPGINGNYTSVDDVMGNNREAVKDYIYKNIKSEIDNILSFDKDGKAKGLMVENGLWVNGKIQGIDKKYLDSRGDNLSEEHRALIAISDFVINSMVNQANIQMIFGGDLANYSKENPKINGKSIYIDGDPSKINPDVINELAGTEVELDDLSYHSMAYEEAGKQLGVNLSKRLKEYISPGNRLANSFGKDSLQVMLSDKEVSSQQLLSYARHLYSDTWKNYEKDINDFIELDNLRPEDRTEVVNIEGVPLDKYEYLKNKIKKELPKISPYMKINNTDAQEYVTWEEHINQLIEQGRLSQEDAKNLSKKLKDQTKNGVTNKNKLTEEESRIVMQPTKPLYAGLHFENYGVGDNIYNAQRYVYIKSSSFPLLPELTVAFPELDMLRQNIEKLQNQNKGKTVRVSYNSANKVGAIKNAQPVSSLYKEMSEEEIKSFGQNNSIILKKENFSIQQDKPFHTDSDIVNGLREQINMGTQMEDIILGNGINQILDKIFPSKFDTKLLEDLDIISVDGKISGNDLAKIYNYLAEQQQKLLSNKLLRRYGIDSFSNLSNNNIRAYEALAKDLNSRLSNRQDQDGITLIYKVSKEGKVLYLNKQELTDSGLKPLRVEFKVPTWMLPNSNKFESVLNSIINNNSIRLKISGFSGPVASQAGFKMRKQTMSEYFADGGNKGVVFTDSWTGELNASRYDNGNLKHFQILAPNKFRINKIKEDGTIYQELIDVKDYINPETGRIDNSKLPKEVLEMFSFRIPTSSHQSGSMVEIVGFLPHNAGDLIIVPGESTIQLGEDYDIDVRNFYMLNTINDANGNIKSVSSSDVDTNIEESIVKLYEDYKLYKAGLIANVKDVTNSLWMNNQENIADLAILEWTLENVYKNKTSNTIIDAILSNPSNLEGNIVISSDIEVNEIKVEIERLKALILPQTTVEEGQNKYNEELRESLRAIREGFNEEKNLLYHNLNKNNKLLEQYLENQIISTYTSVFSSTDGRVTTLINQALNTDFAESTAEMIDNVYNNSSSNFSIYKPLYQQEVMTLGASGKLGIGVHSNWVTFNSIMQQFSTDEKPLKIDNLNLRFGNLETNGRLGKINSDSFIEGKQPKEYIPRPIAIVNMENQNSSTDNQKLQIMGRRNENRYTINAFALMCNLGLDSDGLKVDGTIMSYPSLFISQPIIRDYVRLMEYYSSLTTGDVYGVKNTVINELKKIYGKGVPFDEDGNMKVDIKENSLIDATSVKLFNELSSPTTNIQWALLENFLSLDNASQDIIKIQSSFNIENNGLGVSFFDTISKKEFLEYGINEMNFIIPGIKNLIGDYVDLATSITEKTREDYLEEGYIEVSDTSPILIKPSTYFGHKIVNSITQGYNLWKNIFPFDEKIIKEQIDKVVSNSNVRTGSKAETELKYKIVNNMQDYVYSNMIELFGTTDVNSIREELMLDTSSNKSLASVLQYLRENRHPLMSEPFFKDLAIQLNKTDNPSLIIYNRSTVNSIQKNQVYKILKRYNSNREKIFVNGTPLSINGKDLTYKELVKKLLQYSFLANQERGAIGFRNQFPLEIFDEYGVTSTLTRNTGVTNTMAHSIIYNGPIQTVSNILGTLNTETNIIENKNEVSINEVLSYINLLNRRFGEDFSILLPNGDIMLSKPITTEDSNFVRQYFQHNIEDAIPLGYKKKKAILSRLRVKSMKDVSSFYLNEAMSPLFLQADNTLFEFKEDGAYHRVNKLGGFGINEFNVISENNNSMIKENNYESEGVSESVEPLGKEEVVEIKSNNKALQFLERTIEQDGQFKVLSQLLLPYVKGDTNIIYKDIIDGVNGVYDEESNTIFISNKLSEQDTTPVILEEILHSVTKELGKDFTVEIVDGDLKFNFSNVTNAQARTLAKVYNEGWKAIKSNLIKRLGSEEAAINRINSVIDRVGEAKRAIEEGKKYSLNLSSVEDTLIYRGTNVHEFLASMFFDKGIQTILNNTEYLKSNKSIFQKFIDLLARVIFPNINDNSILKASIQSLVDYLSTIDIKVPEETEAEFSKELDNLAKTEEEANKLMTIKPTTKDGINLMDRNVKMSVQLSLDFKEDSSYKTDVLVNPKKISITKKNPTFNVEFKDGNSIDSYDNQRAVDIVSSLNKNYPNEIFTYLPIEGNKVTITKKKRETSYTPISNKVEDISKRLC